MSSVDPDSAHNASAFWRFSLRFYREPGVAAACIELQDEAGVDVNVLLYLLFLAAQRRALTRDDVAGVDAVVAAWRERVVRPLRALRRELKGGIDAIDTDAAEQLRSEVKRIELQSERIQQETLERLAPASTLGKLAATPIDAARINLAAYGESRGGLRAGAVTIVLDAFEHTHDKGASSGES